MPEQRWSIRVVSTALANGPAIALYEKHGYRRGGSMRAKGSR